MEIRKWKLGTGNSKMENHKLQITNRKFSRGKAVIQLQKLLRRAWKFVREACGENDYARYRATAISRGELPLTPEAFYLSGLHNKYSRPNRCC